jgi:hypothetical protein
MASIAAEERDLLVALSLGGPRYSGDIQELFISFVVY